MHDKNELERLADRLDHLDGRDGEERDEIEMIAAKLRAFPQPGEAMAEAKRAISAIRVAGQIDGYDVIRRLSVIEIIDARAARLAGASQ